MAIDFFMGQTFMKTRESLLFCSFYTDQNIGKFGNGFLITAEEQLREGKPILWAWMYGIFFNFCNEFGRNSLTYLNKTQLALEKVKIAIRHQFEAINFYKLQ